MSPRKKCEQKFSLSTINLLFSLYITFLDKSNYLFLYFSKMSTRSLIRFVSRPFLATRTPIVSTPITIRHKAYKKHLDLNSRFNEPEMSVEEAQNILRSISKEQRTHLTSKESIGASLPEENELRSKFKAAKHRMLLHEHWHNAKLKEEKRIQEKKEKKARKWAKIEHKRQKRMLKTAEKAERKKLEEEAKD